MIKYILISFVIIYLILSVDCSGRQRNNPLDPLGNSKPPVELYLYPDGKHIKLEWEVNDLKDYKGFRIYRSMDDTTNFQLLKEVDSQIHSYTDSSVNLYQWYYYRVSVLGYQVESSPSKIRKTLPGPGVIDILSRYGYSIHEYSYDLLHTLHLYDTEFPPINWEWDQYNRQVWLAYAQYRSISKLNLSLGYEDFLFEDHFLRPVDVKWDQSNRLLYILDSQKAKIYSLFQQVLSDSIELPNDDYFKMLFILDQNIVAIDSDKVNVYSVQGTSNDTIQMPEAFVGQDLLYNDGFLYILAANIVEKRSLIMKFEPNTGNIEENYFDGYFEIFAKTTGANYFWGSEFVDLNNYHLVKLSETGQRLFDLTTSGEFSDMQINKIDHSLVIVQRYLNRIALYDSSGSLISENFEIYDPVKTLIR
jgi:hypothetical protein